MIQIHQQVEGIFGISFEYQAFVSRILIIIGNKAHTSTPFTCIIISLSVVLNALKCFVRRKPAFKYRKCQNIDTQKIQMDSMH